MQDILDAIYPGTHVVTCQSIEFLTVFLNFIGNHMKQMFCHLLIQHGIRLPMSTVE
jgi:hypothetical protein